LTGLPATYQIVKEIIFNQPDRTITSVIAALRRHAEIIQPDLAAISTGNTGGTTTSIMQFLSNCFKSEELYMSHLRHINIRMGSLYYNITLNFCYHDASVTQDLMDTKTSESFQQSKVFDYSKSTRAYSIYPKARTCQRGRQTTYEG